MRMVRRAGFPGQAALPPGREQLRRRPPSIPAFSREEPKVSENETVSDRAMRHDLDLEKTVQEALSLRLKMNEIAKAAGLSEVVLWRWRTRVRPAWDRREQGIAGIRNLIEETRRDYINSAPDGQR